MSDFDDIQINAQPAPRPVSPTVSQPVSIPVQPLPAQPVAQRGGVSPWLAGVLAFLAVLFFVLWLGAAGFVPIPSPGPGPNPIDGDYVAIFYDDEEMQGYSRDQQAAISSAAVAQFLTEKVTGWKKIDVDQLDELSNLDPVYKDLADMHRAKLPWVSVKNRAGRTGSEPVESPDQIIELVNRIVK